MTQLKALIFDVDGTLAETERDGHRIAFNRAFSHLGLNWVWNEQLYADLLTVTGGKERLRFYMQKYLKKAELTEDDEQIIKQIHRCKTDIFRNILQSDSIALRPGVARLIQQARAHGIRLAIATTTTVDNVHALICSRLGDAALAWFDVIAAGDVVANKKPAADIYHYCLNELELAASDCLAIEDSENGLKSALAAGLKTIVTCNSYTQDEDFSGASAVFDHLGEQDMLCRELSHETVAYTLVNLELLKAIHAQ